VPSAERSKGDGRVPPDEGRLAVLASGTGTILEALIGAGLPIVVVGVDRPCRAAEIAEAAGLFVESVVRRDFSAAFDRDAYTGELIAALRRHRVGTVAMAGFATVLGPAFFPAFGGRVLNTHPSLLPAYKGWHAVELDAGPILSQEKVPIFPGDTEETLHERIKQVERRLYPATIRTFLETAGSGAGPGIAG
jgi:phosphoribosylglycinamide formyltransferase-1